MRKYRKPLPADYTGRKKSDRPTHFWENRDLQSREPTLLEILEALAKPGCPICFLTPRSVQRYLAAYCHESVTDVPVRERIRAANGFCTRHAHQFLDQQDALAAAITYADVIKKLIARLDEIEPVRWHSILGRRLFARFGFASARANALAPDAECPACAEQAVSERRYTTALAVYLAEPALRAEFESSRGLCMIHLPPAVEAAGPEALQILVTVQRAAWTALREHLDEIVRKADYRFANEGISPDERAALLAAINLIAGEREIR